VRKIPGTTILSNIPSTSFPSFSLQAKPLLLIGRNSFEDKGANKSVFFPLKETRSLGGNRKKEIVFPKGGKMGRKE